MNKNKEMVENLWKCTLLLDRGDCGGILAALFALIVFKNDETGHAHLKILERAVCECEARAEEERTAK